VPPDISVLETEANFLDFETYCVTLELPLTVLRISRLCCNRESRPTNVWFSL